MSATARPSSFYRVRALQLLSSPWIQGRADGPAPARDRALLQYLEKPFAAECALSDPGFVTAVRALIHVIHGEPFEPHDTLAGLRQLARMRTMSRCRALALLRAHARSL